jgi:NAD(P)-dependent dehydrogenase (short-subunit alcohol dehydrogenase family)
VPGDDRQQSGPGGSGDSAVVTGAAKGIGRAILDRLLADGWHVIAVVRGAEDAERLERELGDRGAVAHGDVSELSVLADAAAAAELGGPLKLWVSNAASVPRVPLDALTPEDLRSVLATNLDAAIWGAREAVRRMLAHRGGGSIVNVSSIHGRVAFRDHVAYEVSKGGLDALTRNIAVQYGRDGIRANSVAPGPIMTPHMRRSLDNERDPDVAARKLEAATALGRIGEAVEVAATVAFLAGEGSYITGQTIYVDGGWSALGLQEDR